MRRTSTAFCLPMARGWTADVVLANADLPYVYQHLLPQDGMVTALSLQALLVFGDQLLLGDGQGLSEALGPAYPFPGRRLPGELRAHRSGPGTARQSQSLRSCPGASRPFHGSARAGYPDRDRPGRASEREWRTGIGDRASRKGARSMCFAGCGSSASPTSKRTSSSKRPIPRSSWAKRYNLVKGSTHGLSHRLTQMAYFRPANRHPRYQNLYFVGASTHPGTGIPTAMVSGRLVSERIQEELNESIDHFHQHISCFSIGTCLRGRSRPPGWS